MYSVNIETKQRVDNITDNKEKLKKEWERLNRLGTVGCKGAVMLRIRYMDKIAVQIGYPLTMDVYLEETAQVR